MFFKQFVAQRASVATVVELPRIGLLLVATTACFTIFLQVKVVGTALLTITWDGVQAGLVVVVEAFVVVVLVVVVLGFAVVVLDLVVELALVVVELALAFVEAAAVVVELALVVVELALVVVELDLVVVVEELDLVVVVDEVDLVVVDDDVVVDVDAVVLLVVVETTAGAARAFACWELSASAAKPGPKPPKLPERPLLALFIPLPVIPLPVPLPSAWPSGRPSSDPSLT